MQDDVIVMSSAHNGAEISLSEVSSEELEWIRSILPDDVRLTSQTQEELAELWGNQPPPRQSIDEACMPVRESGLDMNALAVSLFESLVRLATKATQAAENDKPVDETNG